jgi:hypothetical protein
MATYNINNQPLAKNLRTQLENNVRAAREVAEKGACAALSQLALGEAKAPDYLTDELKALRRRMRAHGRALGDTKAADDTQSVQHLVWEVAYEHWHRMLFARFLSENGLLLWELGAAVSLDDCEALVQEADPAMNLAAKTKWELAGKLAARMLPQVFKPQSPVFELAFAPEHQRELERLLANLPPEVFTASDSLGWVYQFWQAKRKQEVNDSEVKIGADELPAVTQLFTEPYMVDFLLHNSLGAWWVTRHPDKTCPIPLTYLRTQEDGTPAAGKFEHWPNELEDFKLLDPCCGSGHFLVAAFLLLVHMRMVAEGLSAVDAVDAVLEHNLHGLELDARCVEIAVFALAMAAWRFPDENGAPLGVRVEMPAPRIACCGLKVAAKPEDWMALVSDDAPNATYLRQELGMLHASFAEAPLLGSLLDPARSLKNDLVTANFDMLRDLLRRALATERPATLWGQASELLDDSWDLALTANGLLDAASLLEERYHLVVTNVPYLTRKKQHETLKKFCDSHYPNSKNDLANVFLERCIELSKEDGQGVAQVVMTQNWLSLSGYRKHREELIRSTQFDLLVNLGGGADAFENGPGNITNICMVTLTNTPTTSDDFHIHGLEVGVVKGPQAKSLALVSGNVLAVAQLQQLKNPDCRISLDSACANELLGAYCSNHQGLSTGDNPRFRREHWEVPKFGFHWEPEQSTVRETSEFAGRSGIIFWEEGTGQLYRFGRENVATLHNVDRRGEDAWGRRGVAVSQMGVLPATLFGGQKFDTSVAVLIPRKVDHLPAVWCYCSSPQFNAEIRKINPKISIDNGYFGKVYFD